jgi:hypothetical protein
MCCGEVSGRGGVACGGSRYAMKVSGRDVRVWHVEVSGSVS